MADEGAVRQRRGQRTASKLEAGAAEGHPGGHIKHSGPIQILRLLAVIGYFFAACSSIVATQLLGVPLYWINRDLYYVYMALTKQSFGIAVTTLTQWWAPTVVRMSGDASVAGQLRKTADGRVECRFPERLVLIANHQIYSDWLYLWWITYTNQPQMHGYIFIILKESLKHMPILGWGMRFYGFIFMSRKWGTDQARLAYRLGKLKQFHAGSTGLDPMWLLLFPEGTNVNKSGRANSAKWATKAGVKDMQHLLLPRSTGFFFCLNELKGTLDYIYDCTVAYEGVGRGMYGESCYTLHSTYLQGRPPPSVNMYWRRFAVKEIPLDSQDEFDSWLRERWHEKDSLMEYYLVNGKFPASKTAIGNSINQITKDEEYIEAEVKLKNWWEVGNIFIVLATFSLLANMISRAVMALYNKRIP